MILGHNHPAVLEAAMEAAKNGLSFGAATEAEVTMAQLVCDLVPSIQMVCYTRFLRGACASNVI